MPRITALSFSPNYSVTLDLTYLEAPALPLCHTGQAGLTKPTDHVRLWTRLAIAP
jgi:hypothetical protein